MQNLRESSRQAVFYVVTLLYVILTLSHLFSAVYTGCTHSNRSDFFVPDEFYTHQFNNFPYGSVIYAKMFYFGVSCLQRCGGVRPDITIFNIPDILYYGTDIFSPVYKGKYPLLTTFPDVHDNRFFDTCIYENVPYHTFYIEPTFYQSIVRNYIEKGKTEEMIQYIKATGTKLIPVGMWFRVLPRKMTIDPVVNYPKAIQSVQRAIFDNLTGICVRNRTKYQDDGEAWLLSELLKSYGNFCVLLRLFGLAREYYGFIRVVDPLNPEPLYNIGLCWLNEKEWGKAAKCFNKAADMMQSGGRMLRKYKAYLREAQVKQAMDSGKRKSGEGVESEENNQGETSTHSTPFYQPSPSSQHFTQH